METKLSVEWTNSDTIWYDIKIVSDWELQNQLVCWSVSYPLVSIKGQWTYNSLGSVFKPHSINQHFTALILFVSLNKIVNLNNHPRSSFEVFLPPLTLQTLTIQWMPNCVQIHFKNVQAAHKQTYEKSDVLSSMLQDWGTSWVGKSGTTKEPDTHPSTITPNLQAKQAP